MDTGESIRYWDVLTTVNYVYIEGTCSPVEQDNYIIVIPWFKRHKSINDQKLDWNGEMFDVH